MFSCDDIATQCGMGKEQKAEKKFLSIGGMKLKLLPGKLEGISVFSGMQRNGNDRRADAECTVGVSRDCRAV
jgi:hypothetical protein